MSTAGGDPKFEHKVVAVADFDAAKLASQVQGQINHWCGQGWEFLSMAVTSFGLSAILQVMYITFRKRLD